MPFWNNIRVTVTGGAGFIGSHIVALLRAKGCSDMVIPRSHDLDLTSLDSCIEATRGADVVIHAAAVVGGIGYNLSHPADTYYRNILMNSFVLEAARLNGVSKTVLISSACAYPLNAPVPLKEEDLMNGAPESTNGPYGYAKRMMAVQAKAYYQQYGMNCVVLVPFNAFGPRDDFDPKTSHVIPALIRKCLEEDELVVWGDGTPTRNFFYVEDFARAVVLAAEKLTGPDPVNIGTTEETSIKEAVEVIVRHTGFQGPVRYDPSKPNGQPRRAASIAKAQKLLGYEPEYTFEKGIQKTIDWYLKNLKGQKEV